MAKNSNSKRQRDFSNPTYQSLDSLLSFRLRPPPLLLPLPDALPAAVLDVGDRRLWRPDAGTVGPAAVQRSARRLVASEPAHTTAFSDPRLVALCVRRKIRREVIMALKKNRKGAGAKRRRNEWSDIKC